MNLNYPVSVLGDCVDPKALGENATQPLPLTGHQRHKPILENRVQATEDLCSLQVSQPVISVSRNNCPQFNEPFVDDVAFIYE